MRIRLNPPELVPDLLAFLNERVDIVGKQVSEQDAEVSVLGSFADGGRTELNAYLREWRAAHPHADVEILTAAPSLAPEEL